MAYFHDSIKSFLIGLYFNKTYFEARSTSQHTPYRVTECIFNIFFAVG